MSKSADGPVGGHRRGAEGRSTRFRSSSPSYNVTYVTVGGRRTTTGSTFATAAAYTGVMVAWGCAVWGTRLLLPARTGVGGGGYPVLLPALSDLRLRRVVQPVDRRLQPRRGRVRSVRRRRRGRALQPAHRHLRARRRGVRARTARAARPGVQPAHRHVRRRPGRARTSTAAGARRACSAATTGRSTSRVTNNATGNTTRVTQGSGGGEAVTAGRRRRADDGRALGRAATCTPATTATSTGRTATAGRSTDERRLEQRPAADAGAEAPGAVDGAGSRGAARWGVPDGRADWPGVRIEPDREPVEQRPGSARRRHGADRRLQRLPARDVQRQQLSWRRRHAQPAQRAALVAAECGSQ